MNQQASELPDQKNQRREQRIPLTRPFTGQLLLRLPGQADIPVVGLRNVSAGGASVVVRQALSQQQELAIGLNVGDARMEFSGRVAWCRPIDKDDLQPGHALPGSCDLFAVGMMIHGPGSFAAMVQLAGPVETTARHAM